MGQPRVQRFHQLAISTVNVDPPFDTPSTPPQFTLTPKASPTSRATIAATFMYNLPAGTAAVPPFVWTPWVRDPVTGFWAACAPTPPLNDRSLYNLELDACEVSLIPTDNGAGGIVTMLLSER
jgi:hypothetical protein